MKNMVFTGCAVLMGIAGVVPAFGAARINHAFSSGNGTAVTFTADPYILTPITLQGESFSQIKMEGAGWTMGREQGAPELPVSVERIMIGTSSVVRLETVKEYSHTVENVRIAPSKGSAFSAEALAARQHIFGAEYQQNALYPAYPVTVGTPFIMRDVRGVALKYHPFQYNPVTRQLRVIDSVTVNIVEETSACAPNPQSGRIRGKSAEFEKIYKDAFLNYGGSSHFRSALTPVPDGEKMVVIAPTKFIAALKPFVEWKNRKGIRTELVEYTDVYTGTISAGKDTAKVKDIIRRKYDEGVSYFLLAGGNKSIPYLWEDKFPGPPRNGQPDSLGTQAGTCDPRYVMLDGDDYYVDAFIGRFPSDSLPRMEAMVNKAINYEMYPDTAGSWGSRAVGFGSAADIDSATGRYDYNWVDETLDTLARYDYTDIVKVYDYPSPATVSQGYDALNAGGTWVNYMGHSGTYNWATPGMSTHTVDTLKNGAKLPVVIVLGCSSGIINQPYQSYPVTGVWDRCMAEAFMWNPTGGSIIYLGGTTLMPWSEPYGAVRDMTTLHARGDYRSIGAIIANGEVNMLSTAAYAAASDPRSIRDLYNMTSLIWATYGDPSLAPYSATPTTLQLSHSGEKSANFSVSGPIGTRVSIYSPADSFLSVQEITGSDLTFDISACTSSVVYVTGTARNSAPFLDSVNCSGLTALKEPTNTVRVQRIGVVSAAHIQAEVAADGVYDISIYSMDGKKVLAQTSNLKRGLQNISWNGRSFARGTYILTISGSHTAMKKQFFLL